jgi:hypothetical protein
LTDNNNKGNTPEHGDLIDALSKFDELGEEYKKARRGFVHNETSDADMYTEVTADDSVLNVGDIADNKL